MFKVICVISYIVASSGASGTSSKELSNAFPSLRSCAESIGLSHGIKAKRFASSVKSEGKILTSVTLGCIKTDG